MFDPNQYLDNKEEDIWLVDAHTALAAATNPQCFYHGKDVYRDNAELSVARDQLRDEIEERVGK